MSTMKFSFAIACVTLILIPFKVTSDDQSGESENESKSIGDNIETKLNSVTDLDMNGRLKRMFALEAALAAPERNMVCSPISALVPLGKLALGARGRALKELYAAIGVKNKSKLKAKFRKLIHTLQYVPGVTLDVASRLYISSKGRLQSKFNHNVKEIFKSSCEKVDFSDPSNTAETINSWVAKQTNGMISDIVSPADISKRTSLILVNAVYFNGNWKEPFSKVESGTFHSPRGQRKVPMMQQKATHNYHRSSVLNAQIVELPYKNDQATFVIVLPYKNDGLPILLNALNVVPHLLSSEMAKMRLTNVDITMPKFKVQTELNLNTIYQKIGVHDIFNSPTALPDIVEKSSLTVSKAVQKTIIEVTELGTEAAAASVLNLAKSIIEYKEIVVVDHPFIFYIKLNSEQLFAGIYTGKD